MEQETVQQQLARKSTKRKTRVSSAQTKLRAIQLNVVFPFRNFSPTHIAKDGDLQNIDKHSSHVLQWLEDEGLNEHFEFMNLDSVPKNSKDATVVWTPAMGTKANVHLTFKVTERSVKHWKKANWDRLSIFGTKASFFR